MPTSAGGQQRLLIKIPQIARWKIAGIPETRIAQLLKMTPQGVGVITASQEYKEYEAALLNQHLGRMDAELEGRVEVLRDELRGAVPAALRCLVEVAKQRKDLKAAMAASIELLDRDPDKTLAKNPGEGDGEHPDVPAAVLDAAVEAGNNIATTYTDKAKETIN